MWLSILGVALIVVGFSNWVYRWRNPECEGFLPPGSMGLPIIGESMEFSSHPLEEIPPFIKTELQGFTIPAGWIVVVCPPSVHVHSNNDEDPHVFNPWCSKEENYIVHPKSSWHLVGVSDYVLEQISPSCKYHSFLHYLVTKFRWIMKIEGNIVGKPGLCFRDEMNIHVSERNNKKMIKISAYEQLIVFNFML